MKKDIKPQVGVPRWMKLETSAQLIKWAKSPDFKDWEYDFRKPILAEIKRRKKRAGKYSPLLAFNR